MYSIRKNTYNPRPSLLLLFLALMLTSSASCQEAAAVPPDTLAMQSDSLAPLLTEAMKHLGARYAYGGKGPNVFDCSGFTSYVFRQHSKTEIGHSSREQYARTRRLKRSEMQPGDLVFFTSPRSRKGVGHVGIVVEYDTKTDTFTFIHASINHGVRITKSTDGYYGRRYVGAGRVKEKEKTHDDEED